MSASEPATKTKDALAAPTAGEWLVRRLRMRLPDDPHLRRAQGAFAIMFGCSALLALTQAILVTGREGLDVLPNAVRVFENFALSLAMFVSLGAFLWRGRVVAAARLTCFALLLWVASFGYMFGLRGSPTPFAMTFGAVAALALVESPKKLALWGALFAIVLAYSLVVTPPYAFQPARLTQVSSVLWTYFVFVLFLSEFRRTVSQSVESLSSQTATLEATNSDLRKTMAERDRLSEELANSQRLEAMGRMAGSIAHDFNNLLTVIRGYAGLIADDTPASSPRRAEVDLLVQAVGRASGVTREVLDFASPRPIALQPLNLTHFVRDLLPSFRGLLSDRVTLDVDVATADCHVYADRAQLERLLLNLLTNARDVTPPGGQVRVQVLGSEHQVFCRVVDGGTGVPIELRDRIFEPFFTTKGTTGGTGLGLASAYSIARQHHGALSVSDEPGGGAAFTLELPRTTSPVGAVTTVESASTSDSVPRKTLDGVRVMLVEDDDAVRRLATRLLLRSGATVTAFDNGVDAVDHLVQGISGIDALQLIVTDLRLPRGSGAEVIDAARRMSPSTALVAISGFLEDPAVAERAARGELRFLSKPFSETQLLEAIDEARRCAVR